MCTHVYFLSVVHRCWTFRQPPWGAMLNTSAMRPAARMGCHWIGPASLLVNVVVGVGLSWMLSRTDASV